jgi:anti-sigma B factor antagonist
MRQHPGFGFDIIPARGRVVVALAGELDIAAVPELRAAIDRLRDSGFGQIVVDLRAVEFIDSTGIALLIDQHHREGTFAIVYRDGPVRRVLELTGLVGYFEIRPVAVEHRHDEAATESWLQSLLPAAAAG